MLKRDVEKERERSGGNYFFREYRPFPFQHIVAYRCSCTISCCTMNALAGIMESSANWLYCGLHELSLNRVSVCYMQSRKTQQKSRKYINKNHFHCIFDGEISIIFHFRFIFILIVATCIDCCMTFIVSVILTYTTINSARMAWKTWCVKQFVIKQRWIDFEKRCEFTQCRKSAIYLKVK